MHLSYSYAAVLALLLLLSPFTMSAGQTLFSPSLHAIGANARLPMKEINQLERDPDGFLWLGTRRGVFRFDGYSFSELQLTPPGSTAATAPVYVRALLADANYLWIGTLSDGLIRYQRHSGELTYFNQQSDVAISGNQVNALAFDRDGSLWLGSSYGVDRLDLQTLTVTPVRSAEQPDERLYNYVIDMAFDADGKLWLATGKGVALLDEAQPGFKLAQQQTADGPEQVKLADITARKIYLAADNQLWFATQRQGTLLLSADQTTLQLLPQSAETANLINTAIAQPDHNEVWLSGFGGLEVRRAADGALLKVLRQHAGDQYGLQNNLVLALQSNGDGRIWLGVSNVGLQYAAPGSQYFSRFDARQPQLSTLFRGRVYQALAYQQQVLVLTAESIQLLDLSSGQVSLPLQQTAYANWHAVQAAVGVDNAIWFGGGDAHQLLRFEPQTGAAELISVPGSKTTGMAVRRILPLDAEQLLLVTDNGVYLYNHVSKQFRQATDSSGKPFITFVRAVLQDNQQRIWLGSNGGLGLLDLATMQIRRFSKAQGTHGSLRHDHIRQLMLNAAGELLVVHRDGIDKLTGLHDDAVQLQPVASDVAELQQHEDLLLAQPDGSIWYGPYVRLAADGSVLQRFRPEQGALQRDQGRSFVTLHDGRLLHAANNGLLLIAPQATALPRLAPALQLTEISVNHQPYRRPTADSSIILAQGITDFAVRFSLLDLAGAGGHQYRYRLHGHDSDWIASPAELRQAVYTALAPGEYRLDVQGRAAGADWPAHSLQLSVQVLPAYYQTLWFKALLLILTLLLLLLLLRWRVNRVRLAEQRKSAVREALQRAEMLTELMQQKNRLLAEVSHDIRTPLTVLKTQLEAIADGMLHATEQTYSGLQTRLNDVNRLIGDLNRLAQADTVALNIVKSRFAVRDWLQDNINAFMPLLRQQQLQLSVTNLCPSDTMLAADAERLNQVLGNLLTNSLHYTAVGGSIALSAQLVAVQPGTAQAGQQLQLQIADSAPGVSAAELSRLFERQFRGKEQRRAVSGSGLGLSICRAIIQAHGGSITAAHSQLGGVCINISLPLADVLPEPPDRRLSVV